MSLPIPLPIRHEPKVSVEGHDRTEGRERELIAHLERCFGIIGPYPRGRVAHALRAAIKDSRHP